jgi:hypothetical protein
MNQVCYEFVLLCEKKSILTHLWNVDQTSTECVLSHTIVRGRNGRGSLSQKLATLPRNPVVRSWGSKCEINGIPKHPYTLWWWTSAIAPLLVSKALPDGMVLLISFLHSFYFGYSIAREYLVQKNLIGNVFRGSQKGLTE